MDALDSRHGTDYGYQVHLMEGTEPCQPCKDGHAYRRRKDRGGYRTKACRCGARIRMDAARCKTCELQDTRAAIDATVEGDRELADQYEPVEVSPDWMKHADCLDEDSEMFFPLGNGFEAWKQTKLAKKVCDSCPVRPQCLQYALDERIEDGVWGGMTGQGRVNLRRRLTRQSRAAS